MLIKQTVEAFNQVLGSDAPAPGGGSVAALSGALGAELASMVCRLSIGKKGCEAHEGLLRETLDGVSRLADSLLERVDLDTEAFNGVMAAFKLPKETEAERAARTQAIQAGYRQAVQSPFSIAGECLAALRFTAGLLGKSNTNAVSDLGVAALEAYAGLEGAVMNVRINLPSIKDAAYVEEIRSQLTGMQREGCALKDQIYQYVQECLA